MEHAPLRPVPSRPAGPIDPATALRRVRAALPGLSPAEARALALVAVAERPRGEVAGILGIEEVELGAVLAGARKELRRTVSVLGGSGWCERAEALISDRLDGALAAADAGRLDVHLRNCPRCVEHERRLVQATDWLLAGVAGGPAPPPLAEAAPAEGSDAAPAPGTEEMPPAGDPATGDPATGEPATGALERVAPAAVAPALAPDDGATPTPDDIEAAAEVLVTVRTRRQIAALVAWNSMIAIAILLTLVTIGLTIAGIMGAEL